MLFETIYRNAKDITSHDKHNKRYFFRTFRTLTNLHFNFDLDDTSEGETGQADAVFINQRSKGKSVKNMCREFYLLCQMRNLS